MNVTQYLFENSAYLQKDFVLGNKETISYSELNKRSLQLASYLATTYGSDNHILLVSTNNIFFLVSYLGILASGNVCIPVNPSMEKENLSFILKEGEPVICLVENKFKGRIPVPESNIITDSEYLSLIINQPAYTYPGKFEEEKTAEILFTSGSTGHPKGVMLSHKNIISNTESILEYLHLSENDIMEVVLPFHYCYGLSLLHTHLRIGGSVVFNNNFIFIEKVLSDIKKYKCTGLAGVPSHFQILLRKSESFKRSKLSSLRYITQAGGKLHNSFIEEIIDNLPQVDFYVMYGQTEATARLSYLEPKDLKRKLGSIGKGIPGVKLKVVDEFNKEVKPGEDGEVVAYGNNIMQGYFHDEESTGKVIQNGWLHTGDLGTIDEDGYIFLKARKNEIIKIMGKRISPKEIEEVLLSFPNVIACTIEAIDDETTGEAIKATVIVSKHAYKEITADTLKEYCAQKLERVKIPSIIAINADEHISAVGKKIKSVTV